MLISSSFYGLDLTTSFNIGNLGLQKNMASSTPGMIWGSSILVEQKINEQFFFMGGIIVDDIIGNKLDSRISYKTTYLELGLGPSMASINNDQFQLKPALNGYIEIKKEGYFFISGEIYSTIGNLSDSVKDYSQLSTTLSLGLYIPGAICIFSFGNEQYSTFNTSITSVVSKTTDLNSFYQLEADLYKKNVPFNLILKMGYKSFKRIFPANDVEGRTIAGIGSVFIGLGTRINIGRKIVLEAGIDSGLYNFTLSDVLNTPDIPVFIFDTNISFKYKF